MCALNKVSYRYSLPRGIRRKDIRKVNCIQIVRILTYLHLKFTLKLTGNIRYLGPGLYSPL